MTIEENAAPQPVDPSLITEYRGVATSIISDNLSRLPGATGVLPYHAGGPLIGTALTVKTRNGDNLAIHAALKMARRGDVIVVDGGGDVSQALIGEIILTHAESIGVAGFVIDGAIRDVSAIRASDLPCYARGVTHKGPYKNGPGSLNVPVSIGGLVVHPGDLIVGDDDGVVALSPQVAVDLLPGIRAQEERERVKIAKFKEARLQLVRA
ncbi:RraA family protein [Rhizobium sp. PP-F2F-G38]|uniref:Putative 4-hydroxy-4-methyl-2-oxoglutarate aldolase n=1 Tax=Ferranicluibacter rubi TaxID=2715133 RepID=A0AA43ZHA0_9HYPH|nr:RraA family protein [Ferranicluibacter rubi]PYE24088.1 RraA family protein [Rhizobium sp. PP-CC-3A-592]PYE43408.1 RraA family protein [Rhizobium sp. PP-F2F-G20b]PYE94753.1 RraA family protein [Rhizobium sp. PP-F2F-G38]TCL92427.1 RraA family protein [Rhizobium sp. PP-WC-2G-219]TCP81593.1 RraA family protein [Rhizobium sp. PP-CC-2G-626]